MYIHFICVHVLNARCAISHACIYVIILRSYGTSSLCSSLNILNYINIYVNVRLCESCITIPNISPNTCVVSDYTHMIFFLSFFSFSHYFFHRFSIHFSFGFSSPRPPIRSLLRPVRVPFCHSASSLLE